MKDLLLIFAVLAIWFGLSRWVLPLFGIHTCMSGQCPTASHSVWNDEAPHRAEPASQPSEDIPAAPSEEQ